LVISKDMKFILKTLSFAEHRLLFSFLPAYLEFVRENVCGGGGRRGRPMSSLRRESEGKGGKDGERGKGREGYSRLRKPKGQGLSRISQGERGRREREGVRVGEGRVERGEKKGRAKPDRNTVLTNF
jgi:hypothetical protein